MEVKKQRNGNRLECSWASIKLIRSQMTSWSVPAVFSNTCASFTYAPRPHHKRQNEVSFEVFLETLTKHFGLKTLVIGHRFMLLNKHCQQQGVSVDKDMAELRCLVHVIFRQYVFVPWLVGEFCEEAIQHRLPGLAVVWAYTFTISWSADPTQETTMLESGLLYSGSKRMG